ncbi:MAG: hypothetical protein M3N13_01160 [Candidatus Eremiobacteraeota bacterium]|nr:hypothetical protein [Candidatus Eremiobacteraeota bacterium]
MLLRTIFLLTFIAVLGETAVHGASALATATLHQRAVSAARVQTISAIAVAQATLSTALANHRDPAQVAFAVPQPVCVLATAQGCALLATSSLAAMPPPPESSTCPNTNCTVYIQSNDVAREGRIAVEVATNVAAPSGAILASRSGTVAFRTFTAPPYVTLASSLDSTLDDLASGRAGDDGGSAAALGGTAPGTLVHVEYVDASNPAASPIPGDVWHAQMQNPSRDASAWER